MKRDLQKRHTCASVSQKETLKGGIFVLLHVVERVLLHVAERVLLHVIERVLLHAAEKDSHR